MGKTAQQLHPAVLTYRGALTRPERWADWSPRQGDIIVCTPAKCGTTWTQTIIAMLLYGTTQLPDRLSALSPWLDSNLGDAERPAQVPPSPSGRRVVKTHTPADGFPVWDGVRVVAVYRHPLDVFLSIRKHVMNRKDGDNPDLCGPVESALTYYLGGGFDLADLDRDFLASIVGHYRHSVNRAGLNDLILLHYSDMIADHRGTVARLAHGLEITQDATLIDAVTQATGFAQMQSNAAQFAPEGGQGFWRSDAAFFDCGGTRKWQGQISEAQVTAFDAALARLMPEAEQSYWLKWGRDG